MIYKFSGKKGISITSGIIKANSLKEAFTILNENGILIYKIEQIKNDELSIHEKILLYKKRIKILKGEKKTTIIKKSHIKLYITILLYFILSLIVFI